MNLERTLNAPLLFLWLASFFCFFFSLVQYYFVCGKYNIKYLVTLVFFIRLLNTALMFSSRQPYNDEIIHENGVANGERPESYGGVVCVDNSCNENQTEQQWSTNNKNDLTKSRILRNSRMPHRLLIIFIQFERSVFSFISFKYLVFASISFF